MHIACNVYVKKTGNMHEEVQSITLAQLQIHGIKPTVSTIIAFKGI